MNDFLIYALVGMLLITLAWAVNGPGTRGYPKNFKAVVSGLLNAAFLWPLFVIVVLLYFMGIVTEDMIDKKSKDDR